MASEGGVDIATLGLRVDARELKSATGELDKFTRAGERAEESSTNLARRVKTNAANVEQFLQRQESAYRASANRIKEAQLRGLLSPEEARRQGQIAAQEYNNAILRELEGNARLRANDQAYNALAGSLKNVDTTARRSMDGIGRLNNSLIVMARQATNTHPVVGQVADAVGTFAIGTAKMVPILAGIAAIAYGLQKITEDARNAKRELNENLNVLREIARQQGVEGRGGNVNIAIEAAKQEASRVAVLLRQAIALDSGTRAEYERQLRELNDLIRAGLLDLEEDERASRASRRRDELRWEQQSKAIRERQNAERVAEAERTAKELARVERTLTEQRWREEDQAFQQGARDRLAQREEFHNKIVALVEDTNKRIADAEKKRHDEEMKRLTELEQARARSMRALIFSLNNVGRAFGGTTDQVLSLVSAVLALEKVPLETNKDKAIGYGTAALTGAGIGATTGSPFLGAVGGAAAGFSIAGPAGAIVGGVSGIVSGLVEQGRRARQAEIAWRQAFEGFEQLFDTPTQMQAGLDQLDDAFMQTALAAGILVKDIEQARAIVETFGTTGFFSASRLADLIAAYDENLRQLEESLARDQAALQEDLQVRLLRAQGFEEEANALALQIEQERELARARELGYDAATIALLEEVQAQERVADAAKEAADQMDRLFQALNAPSGTNLAYYFSQVGAPGTTSLPTGKGGDVVVTELNIIVESSSDPRETAREVVREIKRASTLGAGDPLLASFR